MLCKKKSVRVRSTISRVNLTEILIFGGTSSVHAFNAGGQQEKFYDSWVFARNALISTITKAPKHIALLRSNFDWRSGVCGRTVECAHLFRLKLRQFYVHTPISHLVFVVCFFCSSLLFRYIHAVGANFPRMITSAVFFLLLVHLLLFVLSVFITIIKQTHRHT